MPHHACEQLLRVFLIFAQLAATVGMGESVHPVHGRGRARAGQRSQAFGGLVDAAHGIDDPKFVSHADTAVRARVALKAAR